MTRLLLNIFHVYRHISAIVVFLFCIFSVLGKVVLPYHPGNRVLANYTVVFSYEENPDITPTLFFYHPQLHAYLDAPRGRPAVKIEDDYFCRHVVISGVFPHGKEFIEDGSYVLDIEIENGKGVRFPGVVQGLADNALIYLGNIESASLETLR